jgi:hypothetical protein
VERKQSIITAGILSGALLVGSAAYALTSGFLAGGADDGAGTLAPVVATTVPASTVPAPSGAVATGAPTTLAPVVAHDDDDRVDDGAHRDHGDDHGGHAYEGRDDDD